MFLDGTPYLCTYDRYNDSNSCGSSRSDRACDIFCEPFHPCVEDQGGARKVRFDYQPFRTKAG